MSFQSTCPKVKLKHNQATIVAYAKEVEKLRSEISFLRAQLANVEAARSAKHVSGK